jgi:hypothetical protein
MASTEDLLKKQYGTLLSIDRHIDQKNTTVLLTNPSTGEAVIGLILFVSGVPVTKYYLLDGSPYIGPTPISTIKTPRRFVTLDKITVTSAEIGLNIPPTANYAEVYINSTACIWGFSNSNTFPINASANTKIVLESEEEMMNFLIRASTSTFIIVHYFNK